MTLNFNVSLASGYKSKSQIARVLTETWIRDTMFCVRWGSSKLSKAINNRKVTDFICPECGNTYELKSKAGKFGNSIVDGNYFTMIDIIQKKRNPDFLLLSYDREGYCVSDLAAIPRHFFTPSMIQKRDPLRSSARRSGWVGCNVLIDQLPEIGKVPVVKDSQWRKKEEVIQDFQKASFLDKSSLIGRTWLLDIMNCIGKIPHNEFSLQDVYLFEEYLQSKHPENHNIRAKIRQQLQVLRDKGIIVFKSRGQYQKL